MQQLSLDAEDSSASFNRTTVARPFVKWVGGKRSLLGELTAHMPESYTDYFEPFVGGGAFFFELATSQGLRGRSAFLRDMNFDLINTYQVIKNGVEPLILLLKEHARKHSKDYYYQVRSQHHLDDRVAIAARFIYLNRTCFNGLWRVNRKGEFNVPMGSYKNPRICHDDNLRACQDILRNTDIRTRDFRKYEAKKNDFVYFDPPYHPLDETSFTSYYKHSFGWKEQIALRDVCLELKDRGAKVMVSNSATLFIQEIYEQFKIHRVQAPRMVNSRADKRGLVDEFLITSY